MIFLIDFFNKFFFNFQNIDIRCFDNEFSITMDDKITYPFVNYYIINNKKVFKIIYYIGEKLIYVEN